VAWRADTLPGLLRALGEAEAPLRARLCPAVAAAAVRIPGAAAPVLGRLLSDPSEDERVRAAAAWAAGSLPGAPLRAPLERAAAADPKTVADNAAAALTAGGPRKRAPGSWAGARLRASDGTPTVGAWMRVRLPDGHSVWAISG